MKDRLGVLLTTNMDNTAWETSFSRVLFDMKSTFNLMV